MHTLVYEKFPTTNFTFGDVISLAGKIAVETAFPCIQIKWRYGRTACIDKTEKEENPPGSIDSMAKYEPFLRRYGFTANEMAVLLAGSHGIATASADQVNSGFGDYNFALVNSGKHWIESTLNLKWKGVYASMSGFFQFVSNGVPSGNNEGKKKGKEELMRLPSDMVFFPRVIEKIGSGNVDPSANSIQDYLETFTKVDRSAFDNEFAKVYAKMLEIGVDGMKLHSFNEPEEELEKCPYYSSPQISSPKKSPEKAPGKSPEKNNSPKKTKSPKKSGKKRR